MTALQSAAQSHAPGKTVIIVGLGIAGLTAAIECHRKGLRVIGLEKKPDINLLGDIIGLSGNSVRILAAWKDSDTLDGLITEDITCDVSALELLDTEGTRRFAMPYNPQNPIQGHLFRRTGLVNMLYQHARQLGIDLRFGVPVDGYWENKTEAGVYANDEKISGHCVVAADGTHSKARVIITGENPPPDDTGVIAYRTIFDAHEIADVPEAQWLLKQSPGRDVFHMYYGKDTMVAMGTASRGRYIHWGCALRGTLTETTEAWMQPASPDVVLKSLQDWPAGKKLSAIVASTPPGRCFNQSLINRPPLSRWVSSGGRMVVIGDAAHSFLPYAGQGGNQGIEDAAVLAICLERSGGDVPLALRAMEKIRHQRVSLIQKGSAEAGDSFLNAAWESSATDRPTAYLHQAWVYTHDCVKHAHEEYDKAADAVKNGREYIPTNIPANGRFRQEDNQDDIV
ncbi:FAD-dependent oxidoreductase [Aspergillus melleus]|uniref:FAD-dependent oxidoreductase n=1 Tax=Aspergillus melleus TaxID=138277 RepID=UPI001E8D291A|nr:uncharacterized protein LDX57_005035 [Aspergillus melleus]KAH8427321.1 hypothetical protein LDX57_005035 [Aspergillus melleus]